MTLALGGDRSARETSHDRESACGRSDRGARRAGPRIPAVAITRPPHVTRMLRTH